MLISRLFPKRVVFSSFRSSLRRCTTTGKPSSSEKVQRVKIPVKTESINPDEINEENSVLKRKRKFRTTPKGTRDFGTEQVYTREEAIGCIKRVFKRHGAVPIDTPTFELREVLMKKYGDEGAKLIYDLALAGNRDPPDEESCSLRYDLTVPFARFLVANKLEKFKRYQIGKVYRREHGYLHKRGRYCEFYQCDFDIVGPGESMVQDAECLRVLEEVMKALDVGEWEIKINHRLLMEGVFDVCGIPQSLFKSACSTIDKLDKQPWKNVRKELVEEKRVDGRAADKLGEFLWIGAEYPHANNAVLLDWFDGEHCYKDADEARGTEGREKIRKGIGEIRLLIENATRFGCSPTRLVFRPSLARGLDYYTGVVYEAVMKDFSFPLKQSSDGEILPGSIGSIAAGGRYDKLVGLLAEEDAEKDVPCVGISIGLDRLLTVVEMKKKAEASKTRLSPTEVYVASGRKKNYSPMSFMHEKMRLCQMLWDADFRTETSYNASLAILYQFQYCEKNEIPLMVTFLRDEEHPNTVRVRDVQARKDEIVPEADLIRVLRERLDAINIKRQRD